jgi:lipopolysaccharide/colanic/teichoic acid biosynthesis glycosyltransferase
MPSLTGFCDQDLFETFLTLERKRSERTGNSFALALLEVDSLEDHRKAQLISSNLSATIRETDITGWYQDSSVVGAIFTSFNGAELDMVRDRLRSRIMNVLTNLSESDRKKVGVALHFFPEEFHNRLYPDIQGRHPQKPVYRAAKRAFDVMFSLGVLAGLSPLMLALALLIKCTSDGPALFRQKRLGQFGKEFDFLKFRSMYANNDPKIHQEYVKSLIENKAGDSGVYKIQRDPRITPIGRFLRMSSLDELPQFWNVLKGEMSIVGPRPPIPYEVENYKSWHRRRVIEVKPGITGLWQVQGRSRTTFDEMVRLDLRYMYHQSLLLDAMIILRTPFAIISGSGAF